MVVFFLSFYVRTRHIQDLNKAKDWEIVTKMKPFHIFKFVFRLDLGIKTVNLSQTEDFSNVLWLLAIWISLKTAITITRLKKIIAFVDTETQYYVVNNHVTVIYTDINLHNLFFSGYTSDKDQDDSKTNH